MGLLGQKTLRLGLINVMFSKPEMIHYLCFQKDSFY